MPYVSLLPAVDASGIEPEPALPKPILEGHAACNEQGANQVRPLEYRYSDLSKSEREAAAVMTKEKVTR